MAQAKTTQPNIPGQPDLVIAQPPPTVYHPAAHTVVIQPAGHVGVVRFLSGDPISTTCQSCSNVIVTSVRYEIGTFTYIAAGALCVFGFWLCFWIPFLIDACKDAVHFCPSCGVVLGRHSQM